VLLIEPEDLLRWSLSDVLVQEGYVVAEAATAAQALDLLEQRSFDAMVLDLALPEPNCWSLLHALTRLSTLPAPLLLLPARAQPSEHSTHSQTNQQGEVQEQGLVTGRLCGAAASAMPGMPSGFEGHYSSGSFLPPPAWIEDLLALLKRIRPASVA
jgi:CheY-like chemotaxis protein